MLQTNGSDTLQAWTVGSLKLPHPVLCRVSPSWLLRRVPGGAEPSLSPIGQKVIRGRTGVDTPGWSAGGVAWSELVSVLSLQTCQ